MPGYVYFFLSFAILICGYLFYSKFIERVFAPDYNQTPPSIKKHDGVDFVTLPNWKIFLIQLLNIAGLGPIFGAIMGALYGPAALLWIAFGCVLGGAVHDFLSSMISFRHEGENLPESMGRYLGKTAKGVLRFLCIGLCVLVGSAFVMGPAGILAQISSLTLLHWAFIIFAYYFLATILPIQTLIARIYPFFGAVLIFMAGGVIVMLFVDGYEILPNLEFFSSQHPSGLPILPMLFVTVACGAISGFHATQSPMMVRCMGNVRDGRKIFYGAMIAEGVIALIWATVGLSFYDSLQDLQQSIALNKSPAGFVKEVCVTLLGSTGAIVALIGVVALPISSGDTALRCARLMIADIFHLDQTHLSKRLFIAIPIFVVCVWITTIQFDVVWRYFGWLNQVIAALTLWMISVHLKQRARFYWVTVLPACFMTAICTAYLLFDEKSGIQLPWETAVYIGVGLAVVLFCLFSLKVKRQES